MAKYRFRKIKSPLKKDDPGKWYGAPVTDNRLNTRAVCKLVTRNTTVAPTELESGLNPCLRRSSRSAQTRQLSATGQPWYTTPLP